MRNGNLTFGIERSNLPIGDDVSCEIRRRCISGNFKCCIRLTKCQQSRQAAREWIWERILIIVADLREMCRQMIGQLRIGNGDWLFNELHESERKSRSACGFG